jgi:uncharacterized protein
MLEKFAGEHGLLHTWKKGVARIPAKLDDYAFLVQALMQLASASGENKWAVSGADLMHTIIGDFSHDNGFFYYTPAHQTDMPVRKVDVYDGAIPSANAVMAHNLWICGTCLERSDWMERAWNILGDMSDLALRYSYSFGYWALQIQRHAAGLKTMICAGADAGDDLKQLQARYLPQVYTLTSKKEIFELPIMEKKFFPGKKLIFVCTGHACLPPVSSVQEALQLV